MRYLHGSAAVIAVVTLMTGCVVGGAIKPTLEHPSETDIARLWQEPTDVATRDLFHGAGGASLAPDPARPFEFVREDSGGYSAGYDVRDANGLEWSVKLGPESQTEVVASRILWALGYHQPPTYYLSSWTLTGAQSGKQEGARFRPKLPDRKVVADWSWYENDFIHTQAFRGLVTANLMLNNWDWKTSNNKIYEITADGQTQRVYVVQDLGASLGKTAYPKLLAWFPTRGLGQGSRNDLEDFEAQGFIKRVDGERVEFFYRGIHPSLLELLTTRDVIWVSGWMDKLSDAQWQDAFRAAGYSDEVSRRFIAKLESKVAEALRLAHSQQVDRAN
jgi:hypothetical protein